MCGQLAGTKLFTRLLYTSACGFAELTSKKERMGKSISTRGGVPEGGRRIFRESGDEGKVVGGGAVQFGKCITPLRERDHGRAGSSGLGERFNAFQI